MKRKEIANETGCVAATLLHPWNEQKAEAFVRDQVERILNGKVKSVIHSLRPLATRRNLSDKKKSQLETMCNFFAKNSTRIRYVSTCAKAIPSPARRLGVLAGISLKTAWNGRA